MNKLTFISLLSVPLLMSACVTMDSQNPNQGYNQNYNQGYNQGYSQNNNQRQNLNIGRVMSVRNVQLQSREDVSAPGVIIGGIAGGILGHQIGGGSGKTLATIVGAAGGAYVGNEVAKKNSTAVEALEIEVRDNNGQTIRITQPQEQGYFRNGDKVIINTNNKGQLYISHY